MSWLSIIGRIFFYIALPLTTLYRWLLIALAPILHLGHYFAWALFLPVRFLAKLEVCYQAHLNIGDTHI
jgi:hypothetical protein